VGSSVGVEAISLTAPSTPVNVAPVGPVSASPIVYSNPLDGFDYIFFTTNTATGAGYCRAVLPTNLNVNAPFWNTAAGTFTLQGFASDNGYLVFGNDANELYVIEP